MARTLTFIFAGIFICLAFSSAILRKNGLANIYSGTSPNRCECISKGGDEGEGYRYAAKHQTDFSHYKTIARTITSDSVRNWENLYSVGAHTGKHSGRIAGTPEMQIYTLTGYLYMVKTEADCDLHLEIGTASPTDLRTVAEITKDNCTLQNEILKTLRAKHFPLNKRQPKGIKVTLSGPGFYDGVHPLKTASKYESGSSWEIHPVVSMKIDDKLN